MLLDAFHFASPLWLWGLALIPIFAAGAYAFLRISPLARSLEKFADKHLLPHLVKNAGTQQTRWRLGYTRWSLAWMCLILAMAGPQWRYTDAPAFKPTKDLVILLDLSSSMNVTDVKPSRLKRAREEIGDILSMNKGLTIGLVAYADVPHMVAPLTDDMATIQNLLPSLDTSLITIDGDRLLPAIEMAAKMLEAEPGHNKSILVVSAGAFTDQDLGVLSKAANGATIDTMMVGTTQGAPIPLTGGGWAKDSEGKMLIGHAQANRLQALSSSTGGTFVTAVYDDSDTHTLLRHIGGATGELEVKGRTIRTWDEGFYVPLLVLAFLLLPWLRRNANFLGVFCVIVVTTLAPPAHAGEIWDWFRNAAQQAEIDYKDGHYDAAMQKFQTPYQQGVAAFKAGKYKEAAGFFKTELAEDSNDLDAEYNLGNAELMEKEPESAIKDYEAVLKKQPTHEAAQHNLAVAQKMLEQKKQDEQKKPDENKDKKQDKEKGDSSQGASGDNKNSDPSKDSKSNPKSGEGSASKDDAASKAPSGNDKDGSDQDKKTQDQAKKGGKPGEDKSGENSSGSSKPSDPQGDENKQQGQSGTGPSKTDDKNGGSEKAQEEKPPADPAQSPTPTPQAAPVAKEAPDATNNPLSGTAQDGVTPPDQKMSEKATGTDVPVRTLRDINADQWLTHIQSDPGSFLKNQFMIEERENTDGKRPTQ